MPSIKELKPQYVIISLLVAVVFLQIGVLAKKSTVVNVSSVSNKKVDVTRMYTEKGVLVTASHIPLSQIPENYALGYIDKSKDIAYYIDKNYIGRKVPLTAVTIFGLTGAEITESQEGSFTVKVKDQLDISSGMSGECVKDRTTGAVLGFVSELLPGGNIKCISIY